MTRSNFAKRSSPSMLRSPPHFTDDGFGHTSGTRGQGGDGNGVVEAGPVDHGAGPWVWHPADEGGKGVVASHIVGHAVHAAPHVVLRVAVDVALHLPQPDRPSHTVYYEQSCTHREDDKGKNYEMDK